MKSLVGIIALVLGIFGAISGQILLVSISAISFLAMFLRAENDFRDIENAVKRLATTNSRGRDLLGLNTSLSDRVQSLIDNLIGMGARLNALAWESESDNRASLTFEREVRVDDFSPEELFKEVIQFAEERFRARGGAIVYRRNHSTAWQVLNYGVAGQKLNIRLSHVAGVVFGENGDDFLGLRDGVEEQNMLSDFEPFGVRYSVLAKFQEQDKFGFEGILWLGYSENRVPTKTECSWAEALCRFINLQLNTKTKIRDLHGELRRAQTDTKEQTRFFADLSHDVRTPLNNLKNILALAKFEETSSETRSMLEAAMDNCDHVADMMEDILIYSQSQAGSISPSPRAIPLAEILPKIVATFKGSSEIKGLPILSSKIPEDAVVTMDLKHLKRILSNLLSNALKYTEKGQISIGIDSRSSDTWSVFVRDTGVGIAPEDLEKLFTPFNRLERTASIEGVGLGLALSKILATANGADIVPSSRLGFGTEFELRIPKAMKAFKEQVPSRSVVARGASILLVDDDADYVSTSVRILQRFGFEVLSASSGPEANSLIRMSPPDIVVTDGSMPLGGGEEVCSAASSLGIPVIVVSGKSDSNFASKMRALGASLVLVKPIEMEDLAREILRMLPQKASNL
jgi:signal transduction histidine kinase/ActR/RegA family two-component response regulator